MFTQNLQRSVLTGGLLALAVGVALVVPEGFLDMNTTHEHAVEEDAAQASAGCDLTQQQATVMADFVDAPLSDVARFMTDVTGRDYPIGRDSEQRISLTSHRALTSDQLDQVFLHALNLAGYSTSVEVRTQLGDDALLATVTLERDGAEVVVLADDDHIYSVRARSPIEVTVDKETVAALMDVEGVLRAIRVIPHKSGRGDIDGYRLSGIRRGSLFDQLGVKNGDILHAVNDLDITSADGALMAYQSLQHSSRFVVDLTRRGQKQTLEFVIR